MIIDELSMVAAELFGALEYKVSKVVRAKNTYKKRPDGSIRPFGGINVLCCEDWWQLPPVAGTSLCGNMNEVSPGVAYNAMIRLWHTGPDCIRKTWSLVEPMRCDDAWYNTFLSQCRFGSLTEENYCLIHGFPTFTPTCEACSCTDDIAEDPELGKYKKSWMARFEAKENMADAIESTQCSACATLRKERQRVLKQNEPIPSDVTSTAFAAAPAIYSFNVPRYFTTQLRAREFGKSHNIRITWAYAKDVPLHRDDRELSEEALRNKLISWLGRHDQDTGHIASILPLVRGLPVRLTDRADKNKDLKLYRGRRGHIYGWTPHPHSTVEEVDGDLLMDRMPLVIYVKFDNVTWKIGDLPEGVYPLTPVSRTWRVNKNTGAN